MEKYLVKRYVESIDPEELIESDREYASTPEHLIELYGMENMRKLTETVYQDDDTTDVFRIKKDENGYYVVSYTCVQNDEVGEEEEIYELFKFKLIKLDSNVFVSVYDPEIDVKKQDECLVVLEEK